MVPNISVILTSYNHEKFIAQSIDSVLNQTYTDFELIIIDDHSQDNSWDIIQSYKDERIISIRNEKNIRSGVTFDAIKNISKGKYIAIHHSDDIWMPDKLEKQIEVLEKHREYAACFTNVQLIDENSNVFEPPDDSFYKGLFRKENRNRFQWLNYFFNIGNCLCHPSILIRKEAYEQYGLYNYGFGQIPDFLMWIRLCLFSEIFIIQEELTRFRIREKEKNTSGDRQETRVRSASEYYFMLREFERIENNDDFLKIFPQAEKYKINGQMVNEFALARMCIDDDRPACYKLFGIELLFKILNNPQKATMVKSIYKYTHLDLIKETGSLDVFGIIQPENIQIATLFIDTGKGFTEKICLKKSAYLPLNGQFTFEFDLRELLLSDERIVALRFDPQEGFFSACKLDKIENNQSVIEAKPLNSIGNIDGYDTFLTTDPVYILDGEFEKCPILIKGTLKILNNKSVENEISSIWNTKNSAQEELAQLWDKFSVTNSELSSVQYKLSNTQMELSNTQKELSSVQYELSNTQRDLSNAQMKISSIHTELDNNEVELYNTKMEILKIYNSRGWKLLEKLRAIRSFLLKKR